MDQGGDYLTVIKQNQPDSWKAIDQLFQATRLDPADRQVYNNIVDKRVTAAANAAPW